MQHSTLPAADPHAPALVVMLFVFHSSWKSQRYLVHLLENILVEARNVDDDDDDDEAA